jgi:hypothetical protein
MSSANFLAEKPSFLDSSINAVRSIVSLKEIASMTFIKLDMLLITPSLDVDVVTEIYIYA